MDSKYYVVKLSEPSDHIDSFVCVPRSWIKIILDKTPEDQKILIAYPVEDSQNIKELVKNEEANEKNWKHYWGTVVYTSDVYEDAERWITLGGISPRDNTSGYQSIGNRSVRVPETEPDSCQQNSPTTKEDTPQTKDVPLKNNPNASIKLSLKRNLLSNNADEFYIKQLKIGEKTGGEREVPNHSGKPVSEPNQRINVQQNVTNQEPRTQNIIPTALVVQDPYQSPRQTAMPSAFQTPPNSHAQSCQPADKLIQNCVTQKVDIRRTVDSNHNGPGTYFNVTFPPIQAATNSPSRSYQTSELNQKRISVVPNEYLFQNCDTQEASNERVNNTNNNNGKVYTDITSIQSPMQTSPNYTNQVYQECSHQKQRHIPNDYIVQNRGQQKIDIESSACVKDSDQRTNFLIRNTPSATQALKSLMNRRDEQRIPESQVLTTQDSTLYQKSPRQEVHSKSHDIYQTDQNTYSEDVKKTPKYSQQLHVKDRSPPEIDISQTIPHTDKKNSTSHQKHKSNRTSNTHEKPPKYILKKSLSLEDNLSEITSKSCQLVEQSHLKRDAAGYNVHVHINKIVVSRPKHSDCDEQISLPEFVTKKSAPAIQNTSNFVKESSPVHEKLDQNQDSSDYKVVVQHHPLINKIIITKSNEMDVNNEISPSQSNNSYGQNSFNAVEDCHSVDRSHDKHISGASPGYSQINPGTPRRAIRTTNAGIPYIVNDYFPENVKNGASAIQHCSNLENHSYQISKHLNDQHSALPQNCPTQVPRREMTAAGRAAAADRIDQRPRLQSIRKHKSAMQNMPSVLEHKLGQFAERLHEHQSLLLGSEHLLQHHSTGVQLARHARNINNHDQRVCYRDAPRNTNPPNHRQLHTQNAPNQTPRHSMQMPQLNEKHFAPVYTNHIVPDPRISQTHFVRPTIMNNAHQRGQPIPQNIPVVQNVPNSGHHSCCSCKCSHTKPIVQDQSYGDHRMHQPYAGRTNDGHYMKQSVHPQNNIQNATITVQNPFNTPAHSSPAYVNPILEHYPPTVLDHAVQDTISRELPPRYTEDNCTEQNIYTETNKDVRQHIHKSSKIPEQSLQYRNENQSMQTEELYIDETSNTSNNCIKQNGHHHHSNSSEIPSTTRQDTSNPENMANFKAITEHALMNDLKCIIRKMDSNLCKTYTLIDNANKIFVEYAESFKKTMKVVNEYYELKMNEAEATATLNAKRVKDKRHKKKRTEKARTDDEEHSMTI